MNMRCDRSLIISFLSGLALCAAATLLGCPSLLDSMPQQKSVEPLFCFTTGDYGHGPWPSSWVSGTVDFFSESSGKLYAQPVKIAPVMETLEKGAKVLVLHQKGDWYAVSLPDQRLGWAHQSIFTPCSAARRFSPKRRTS